MGEVQVGITSFVRPGKNSLCDLYFQLNSTDLRPQRALVKSFRQARTPRYTPNIPMVLHVSVSSMIGFEILSARRSPRTKYFAGAARRGKTPSRVNESRASNGRRHSPRKEVGVNNSSERGICVCCEASLSLLVIFYPLVVHEEK